MNAYIVGIHTYCFHAGEPALIIGVSIIMPENETARPCFRVVYSDATEDFIPISDMANYEIISAQDVRAGNIPKISK